MLGACVGMGFLGFFVGILQAVDVLPQQTDLLWLAPSFGASCVLLFAIPHSPFSQPWPVLGGYLVSAFAGVASIQLIDSKVLQACVAVGLSVLFMYYLRCVHPPGGAATLLPVVSDHLGWSFIFNPILIGALCLVWAAIVFNAFFPWRRYPAALDRKLMNKQQVQSAVSARLTHEDLGWALQKMDSFTDISTYDLCQLFELAITHQNQKKPTVTDIASHAYYSNGQIGFAWQVYEVLAVRANTFGQRSVHYRVRAGHNEGQEDEVLLHHFLGMALIPVRQLNGQWIRLHEH